MDKMIRVQKCKKADYFDKYDQRYSEDCKKYDDPGYHKPSLQAEEEWWDMEIERGLHKIYSIHTKQNNVIGFIHLFSFKNNKCETGITVFPKYNWNKGYAFAAYKQLEKKILPHEDLQEIYAETSEHNKGAISLYKKLGYKISGSYEENNIKWLVLTKYLNSDNR